VTVTLSVRLSRSVVERLEREARKSGLSLEEYVLELVLRNLDPQERAREYIETAKNLLEQAREELEKNDVRQAAEKLWVATALAVKAYAEWKEGKKLTSHRELWEYKDIVASELGEWVRDSWNAGNSMHTCFYEEWCTHKDVENSLTKIKKLVEQVEERIRA